MTDQIGQDEAVHEHGIGCWDVDEEALAAIHDVGQSVGAVLCAVDQAGFNPVAVDSAELSHGAQLGHAFLDGFMSGFQRVLGERKGTDWEVCGEAAKSVSSLHALFATVEAMLQGVSSQHDLRVAMGVAFPHQIGVTELAEAIDRSTKRSVITRNDEGIQLGLMSQDGLDGLLLQMAADHHDDGTPGVRFVDITTRLPMGGDGCEFDGEGSQEFDPEED